MHMILADYLVSEPGCMKRENIIKFMLEKNLNSEHIINELSYGVGLTIKMRGLSF